MNDIQVYALVFVVGALLGVVFFVGLWWTIREGVNSRTPALWFIGSLLLRTGMALGGFYFVGQGDWTRLLTCLLGFLSARVLVVKRLSRAPAEALIPLAKEPSNATQPR